jgi:hypothetical protein
MRRSFDTDKHTCAALLSAPAPCPGRGYADAGGDCNAEAATSARHRRGRQRRRAELYPHHAEGDTVDQTVLRS